jgi:hypothetical protein
MTTPLIIDEKDQKWTLLGKIVAIVASRRVKQEMAKQEIAPVNLRSFQSYFHEKT